MGKKIKCLRTNNGGEFCIQEFNAFYSQEGIQRQKTVVYTPQHNNVVERTNKPLVERMKVMLKTTRLSKTFQVKATKTTCYIINRYPLTAIEMKTPMEMWTGKLVNYSSLYIFKCLTYVMYNDQKRTKLDPKSRKYIYSWGTVMG